MTTGLEPNLLACTFLKGSANSQSDTDLQGPVVSRLALEQSVRTHIQRTGNTDWVSVTVVLNTESRANCTVSFKKRTRNVSGVTRELGWDTQTLCQRWLAHPAYFPTSRSIWKDSHNCQSWCTLHPVPSFCTRSTIYFIATSKGRWTLPFWLRLLPRQLFTSQVAEVIFFHTALLGFLYL